MGGLGGGAAGSGRGSGQAPGGWLRWGPWLGSTGRAVPLPLPCGDSRARPAAPAPRHPQSSLWQARDAPHPESLGGSKDPPWARSTPTSSPWGGSAPAWPTPSTADLCRGHHPRFLPCDGRARLHAQPSLFAPLLVGSLAPLPREDLVLGPGVGTCVPNCPTWGVGGAGPRLPIWAGDRWARPRVSSPRPHPGAGCCGRKGQRSVRRLPCPTEASPGWEERRGGTRSAPKQGVAA